MTSPAHNTHLHGSTDPIISGAISDEEFEKIKSYCINPVDSRETGEDKPATLVAEFETPEDVAILDGSSRS